MRTPTKKICSKFKLHFVIAWDIIKKISFQKK